MPHVFLWDRIKAVILLLQDMSYATVIRELGYSTRRALTNWYKEYVEDGDLHKEFNKKPVFSLEDRQKAVNYYLEHGKCLSRTVKILDYPCRPTLDKWIKELAPEKKKHCRSGGSLVKYTHKQEEKAVIALCSRSKSAKDIANEIGVRCETLYNWKNQLLDKGWDQSMAKKGKVSKVPIAGYYPECNSLLNPSINMHLMIANMEHGGKLYPVLIENIMRYYPEVSNVLKKVTEEGQSQGIINNNYNWGELFELYCAAFHGLLVEWSATDGILT